jgi:hypothetical protein
MKTAQSDIFENTDSAPVHKKKFKGTLGSPLFHDNDPPSSVAAADRAKFKIYSQAWYVYQAVSRSPGLTARELWQTYGELFSVRAGMEDKYAVSRSLTRLKDGQWIQRIDKPERKCSVCHQVCSTWKVKFH